MMVLLKDITVDLALQFRERLDQDAIEDYAQHMDELPPIIVFGEENLLADGFHRVAAAQKAGRKEISATRREGGRDEAIADALAENMKVKGVRLTTTERNAGVRALLDQGWVQRKVALTTGIPQGTVNDIVQAWTLTQELPPELTAHEPGRKAVLEPTKLARIATLPKAQQLPVAIAAGQSGIDEPTLRRVIKRVKAGEDIPTAISIESPIKWARLPSDIGMTALRMIAEVFTREIRVADDDPQPLSEVLAEIAANRNEPSLRVSTGPVADALANALDTLASEATQLARALRADPLLLEA